MRTYEQILSDPLPGECREICEKCNDGACNVYYTITGEHITSINYECENCGVYYDTNVYELVADIERERGIQL